MILKIYILGAICGLAYPLIDLLCLKNSGFYRVAETRIDNSRQKKYRATPAYVKLIAALVPVANILFIAVIILIAQFFISAWWMRGKRAFIWWLAGTNIRKGFIFKANLVKRIFPKLKKYYYDSLEKRHYGYELYKSLSVIMQKTAGVATAKKHNDAVMSDAISIGKELEKSEENEFSSKSKE